MSSIGKIVRKATLEPDVEQEATTVQLFLSPVPFWGTIMISAAGILFLLCLFFCCILCIQNSKRKRMKAKPPFILGQPDPMERFRMQKSILQQGLDGDQNQFLGYLYYTLDFKFSKSELSVGLVKLEDLPGSFFSKPSSTFVKVRLHPDPKTYQSKIVPLTHNPEFNESFVFSMTPENQAKSTVIFTVFDYQLFTRPKKIGQLMIPLQVIVLSSVIEDYGQLTEPIKTDDIELELGDVCLSIRYIPIKCKLVIVVIEAKNLYKNDTDYKDPYVKIFLFNKNKLIKKKKTSSIPTSNINPYFNDSIDFDVTPEQIKTCTLTVKVSFKSSLGRPKNVGEFPIGMEITGTGYKHWFDVINNPGQPFAMWHALSICE